LAILRTDAELMKLLSLRGTYFSDEYWGDDTAIPFKMVIKKRL